AMRARDEPYAGEERGRGDLVEVDALRRQRGEFQERRSRVEEAVDPLADEELPPLQVLRPGFLGAALARLRDPFPHSLAQAGVVVAVLLEGVGGGVDPRREDV